MVGICIYIHTVASLFQDDTQASVLRSSNDDEPESTSQSPKCLVFTSLPENVKEKHLAVFCDSLGESIEIESIELFENGKAKAVISGLTSEGITIIV